MPENIHDRQEILARMERGAQVVDVLGPEEFERAHLPGAVNVRLRDMDAGVRTRLDPGRPVIVYCWDSA